MKKNIAVIFSGGTISMRYIPEEGGIVPALTPEEILQLSPQLYELANIHPVFFGNYPSPHIDIERMNQLRETIAYWINREDIDGVVVTHGTDTLEETAYFIDLTLNSPKPIVFVGSMRNASEPDWDGPRNLRDGICIASHPSATAKGVLVCLSEEIHAASEVTKLDTSNISTFSSPNFGPLGRIVQNRVFIYREPVHRDFFAIRSLPRFVPLLKCYAGAEPQLYQCVLQHHPDGLVIEALGTGNVPPAVYREIRKFLSKNIPVILTSRCPIGRVEHLYSYEGAGKLLYEAGVIFADYLNGQKARIKLIAALGAELSRSELQKVFEWAE